MIDKTMFKWGMAVVIFATFVLGVCVSHFCMQHKLAALRGENMSSVRVKVVDDTTNNSESIETTINGVLKKDNIHFIDLKEMAGEVVLIYREEIKGEKKKKKN